MNPQQQQGGPTGPLPPQNPNELPAPQPTVETQPVAQPKPTTPPVINIPGQDPYVPEPVKPADPHLQPRVEKTPYDYNFILNPEKAAKKPIPLAGGSMLTRIAIAGGGLVALLILGVVLKSVLSGGGPNLQPVITAAEEQTELVRVATLGTQNAVSQNTRDLASNVELSMMSAQNQTVSYLKSNGQKVGSATLNLKRNTQTDTALTNATADSNFDSTFTGIMQTALANYSATLQQAYKANPGPKGKALLQQQYDATQLLITQSKQH